MWNVNTGRLQPHGQNFLFTESLASQGWHLWESISTGACLMLHAEMHAASTCLSLFFPLACLQSCREPTIGCSTVFGTSLGICHITQAQAFCRLPLSHAAVSYHLKGAVNSLATSPLISLSHWACCAFQVESMH